MCIICKKDLPPIHFEIEQDLGFATYKNKVSIDKDICKYCFIPESLGRLVTASLYHVGIELYAEAHYERFWEESEWNRDELMTLHEVWEGISGEGIKNSKQKDPRMLCKMAKEWIDSWNPNLRFYLDAPTKENLYLQTTTFIKKSDYNDLINKPKVKDENGVTKITYYASHRHRVSEERQKELWDLGYLKYNIHNVTKELTPRFANNSFNNTRVCVCCGKIKKHDGFRSNKGKAGKEHFIVWECLDCETHRAKKYYLENREEILEKAKSPEGRKQRREYGKSPKGKYSNALRNRFNRHVKNALGGRTPAFVNKDVGISNRDLVYLLEDLSEDWMNHNNYGAGENLDHEGSWHIDHVIPISLWWKYKYVNPFYDISLPERERIGPNHWSNVRPLCSKENMGRGHKDLDFDDVKSHYDKIREIYPERNVGQINLKLFEEQENKKEETCGQLMLKV